MAVNHTVAVVSSMALDSPWCWDSGLGLALFWAGGSVAFVADVCMQDISPVHNPAIIAGLRQDDDNRTT